MMKKLGEVKEYIKHNKYVLILLYIPFFVLSFILVERLVPSGSDYWATDLPIDSKIPFVEAFVIPYCLWYPYLIVMGLYLLAHDVPEFKRYAAFIISGFTLCLLFCALVPNGQNLRPEQFPRDNVFTRMIAAIYAADTNTNVFPSMHVVGVVAACCATFESGKMRRYRIFSLVLSILITASTLFIKQHAVLDIVGSIALSIPLYFIIYRLPRKHRRDGAP